MKIVGLTLCRNEDWVIGLSARVSLRWVDELVILNHASVDDTNILLADLDAEFPGRVHEFFTPDPVWREMAHRQRTLDMARDRGATHIAIIDSDEVLTANLLPSVRSAAENLNPGEVMELWMPCLWGSAYRYRTDRWDQTWASAVVRDSPVLRWETRDGYDFHHRHPMGSAQTGNRPFGKTGGLMHLQFADRRRLLAKQAMYKMIEMVRWPERESAASVDAKYHQTVDETGLATAKVPVEWWSGYEDLMSYLDLAREPWQERENARLHREYGAEAFKGLNLYGTVKRGLP